MQTSLSEHSESLSPQLPSHEISYRPYDDKQAINDLKHVAIMENRRIIKAHYGYIVVTKEENIITQTYVVPTSLKSIRPKINKFASEDLADAPQIESKADRVFMDSIVGHSFAKKRIQLALKVAKHYHGSQKRKSGEPFYLHPVAVVLYFWTTPRKKTSS